ncbi:MAG TPA: AIPR family protein [Pirellulaceae bacterium]|nr:AIPR family protein [Pirellulaceae bacterium]
MSNTTSSSAKITYNVATETTECDITVLFVPTIEIAKALHKYRNSILKYNPRSYLELENNNVNRAIASTITQLRTNEFALYNNGITMLSFGTHFSERIGQKDKAQLIVTQPQIINGGQTAFTLSRLYEQYLASGDVNEIFSNKEVLLKVITFQTDPPADGDKYLKLIEAISKATNQQSPVDEADRRSNDLIQIKLQQFIFDTYGYFYERKRGEFADGIRAGYINRKQIVGRDIIVRMCRCCDLEPAEAWRSLKELFAPHNFNRTLNNEERFPEYFFAFKCYETIAAMKERFKRDKNNRYGVSTYGNGLIYGQYAVTAACRIQYQGEDSLSKVEQIVNGVLGRWLEFEAHVVGLQTNSAYFRRYTDDEGVLREQLNFDNYYKGRTVNDDVRSFFIA